MMKVSEVEIINFLKKRYPKIGDDCFQFGKYIISTDAFVKNVDYIPHYISYKEIGYRAMANALSDIAACGGKPIYALVTLGINKPSENIIKDIYKGIDILAKKFNFEVVGGDISASKTDFLNIVVIGEIVHKFVSRSGAKVGDKIYVTGYLGSSYAELKLMKNNKIQYGIRKKMIPRINEGIEISKFANSMIDISDGLIIDLFHICEASSVCAKIYKNKIPIDKKIKEVAKKFNDNPIDYAFYGGDDYELLFTAKNIENVTFNFFEIGEIMIGEKIKIIDENDKEIKIKGYDQFHRND